MEWRGSIGLERNGSASKGRKRFGLAVRVCIGVASKGFVWIALVRQLRIGEAMQGLSRCAKEGIGLAVLFRRGGFGQSGYGKAVKASFGTLWKGVMGYGVVRIGSYGKARCVSERIGLRWRGVIEF
jgi:hypothetical protein